MIGVGDPIPDVQVWRSTSETVGLRELAGRSPYLLLSYLFDWSSTCTNELSQLNARRDELLATGVTPYGISRDSPWSHVAWAQALDLSTALLSDWNGEAVTGFGIGHDYRGMDGVAERSAFLIDGDGIIRGTWRYEPGQVPDFDELLAAARSLS